MKRYRVNIGIMAGETFEVTANNEAEAFVKAEQMSSFQGTDAQFTLEGMEELPANYKGK